MQGIERRLDKLERERIVDGYFERGWLVVNEGGGGRGQVGTRAGPPLGELARRMALLVALENGAKDRTEGERE